MTGHPIKHYVDFLSIQYGDIVEINGRRYTMFGPEYEHRFGMEEPKYWVRKALEHETGKKKIIKFSFAESFETSFHHNKLIYTRNNQKEAEVLDLCRNHPSFVKGVVHPDGHGNVIQILDFIPGTNFLIYIDSLAMDFETYLQTAFPGILEKLIIAFDAIGFLHKHGLKHGDIRNDHIIVSQPGNDYVWIDFDYDYEMPGMPYALEVFQLGNILINAVGKGFHTVQKISANPDLYGDLRNHMEPGDLSLLHRRRFVNIKKIYPFIPDPLNNLIMQFSVKIGRSYDSVPPLLAEMKRCLEFLHERF